MATSTHAGGWRDFDLPGHVRDLLGGTPVVMDNDANAGALGEFLHGAGKGCSPLFYMTVSTGIGGGVLIGGKLMRGADSWAGEIGHLNVRPRASMPLRIEWMSRTHVLRSLARTRSWRSRERIDGAPGVCSRDVVDMARGLKACIMLLNPGRIVIGGGIGKAGDALFVPLREELARQVPSCSRARVEMQRGAARGR